jgi:phenylpropionate dioxygenase-like ring-hydroxylating dioxygenase large terminal subunit
MFLQNCWYVAAWDTEIGRTPMARTIVGEDVVFYRGEGGAPIALEDRCCHRNMPLSDGRVIGDNLRCGYHGLLYDPAGICIDVPGQPAIPPGAQVKSYPLVERWHWIWIWMGDPALADPDTIPAWDCLDSAEWGRSPGNDSTPLRVACHYELSNDNILDLSHVAYVHENSLGSPGLAQFPIETERRDDGVEMIRWGYDLDPPPLFVKYCGLTGKIDRWQSSTLTAPCHCLVDVGFLPAGSGPDGRDSVAGPRLRVPISTTPETATTSHMFYCQTRNFGIGDDDLTATMRGDFLGVFMEDVTILESQQRIFAARPDAPTVDINVDAPSIAMRAVNRRLIDAETGQV